MIFGNVHLSSFGHCKVVSWKNKIFTDFERKELSYRGRLLAAVEVPTLRSIEATILVRGSTVKDVDKKLKDIGKWLYEAGTAKLFAERDTTHYYLARCTSVSTPERSGASARITVVFTCADNRLYNVYNNQPITTATSEMNNFTFAGKHCLNDMGCVFVMDSMDAVPTAKVNKYEIAGQSGTLRYDSGEGILYEEKSMSGTLYFVKKSNDGLMSEEEITKKLHSVAAWLGNSGRAQLILDSDVSRYYEAEVDGNQSLSRKDWENGSIKLKMTLQPFANDVTVSASAENLVLSAGTAKEINLSSLLPNGIGYATPLTVSVTNKSATAITDLSIQYYDEKNTLKTMRLYSNGFSLSNGQAVTVDSLSGAIAKGAEDGIKWLKSGDFPMLSVNGEKKIKILSGTAATVVVIVSFRVRWL